MSYESRFLKAVRRWVESHGKITEISAAASPAGDKTWLSRALSGQRPFTMEHLHRVLDVIGVDEREFWADFLVTEMRIAPTSGQNLRTVLERSGDSTGDERLILRRIREIFPRTPLPPRALLPIPERVDEIRRYRLSHREVAMAEAEMWLHELWGYGLRRKRWDAAKTGELACALGAWASVRRSLGDPSGAAAALLSSLELHSSAVHCLSYAALLEDAARIVRDLGAQRLGMRCLQEALSLYSIFDERQGWIRASIAIGVFAECEDFSEFAENAFSRCAHHPEASVEDRAAAISNLAWSWQKRERPEDALLLLHGLNQEVESLPPRYRLNIVWVEGKILMRIGESRLMQATGKLEEVFEQADHFLEPVDRFLLFFDLAECYERTGEREKILGLGQRMLPSLSVLEKSPLAKEIGQEVVRSLGEALRGGHTRERAARFREALEAKAAAASYSI